MYINITYAYVYAVLFASAELVTFAPYKDSPEV